MYIYYPSCNYQKFFPETSAKIHAYLSTQPDVVVAGCCHVMQDLPQEGDTIVTVCMSCMRGLMEMRHDIPQISLYEFLLTRKDFNWPELSGVYTLQDCFRARGRHALQDAVRTCLSRMHGQAEIVEMPDNRDAEEFDGSFRLHAPYPQNMREAPAYFATYLPQYVTPLPKTEWGTYFREHVKRYHTDHVICYCNTCYTGAKEGTADADIQVHHLTELLFPCS